MEKINKVVVIGAGISGLRASWELSKAGTEHIII
jgi:protoporphyrinogen oxidase